MRFHREIYRFHTGDFINHATHPYEAHPVGWLAHVRPTASMPSTDIAAGTDGCTGPENCIAGDLGDGTPALWWTAAIALVAA